MKQLVIFTRGLSHTQLYLISRYSEQAETAFDLPAEATQLSAVASSGQKPRVICQNSTGFAFFHAVNLARKLRSSRYDAVYVHGVNSREMLPVLLGARLAGIPRVIACAHEGSDPVTRPLPDWCFSKATASSERLGKAMFRGRALILPDGIVPEFCLDEHLREAWRAAFDMTGRHIYLQISPINQRGNYDRTLDFFRRILALDENARLICVGQGPMRSEILARVEYENLSDFVLLPGDTDNIAPFLMAADALIIPDEGSQAALLPAAQAAGLPCFVEESTDCGFALIREGIYPLEAAFQPGFRLPLDCRLKLSSRSLEKARETGRTAAAIGRALSELSQ